MPDARYVAEIVLELRDKTAAALVSALSNQEAFSAALRKQDDDLTASSERLSKAQAQNTRQLIHAQGEYKKFREIMGKTVEEQDALVKGLKESESAHGDVERATRRVVRALNDKTKSDREIAILRAEEVQAVERLNVHLRENEGLNAGLARINSNKAQQMGELNAKLEEQQKIYERLEKVSRSFIKEQDPDLANRYSREIDDLGASLKRVGGDMELFKLLQEEAFDLRAVEQYKIGMAELHQQALDQDKIETQRIKARKEAEEDFFAEVNRLTEESHKKREALLDEGEKADEARRKRILDQVKEIDRAQEEAVRENERRRRIEQARDIEAHKAEVNAYIAAEKAKRDAVKRLPRAFDEFSKSTQRAADLQDQANDSTVSDHDKIKIEVDKTTAERQAAELLKELEAILAHIEAHVDLEDGEFAARAAEIEAIKSALGTDVHVGVQLDASRFIAEAVAANRAKNSLGDAPSGSGVKGFLGELRRYQNDVSESFAESANRLAIFDNVMRGLLSIGIFVFLNQIIVALGSLVGVLGAVAGAAVQAGSALGGALAAGAAQALPVIGLLIGAMQSMKGVMEASKLQEALKKSTFVDSQKSAKDQVPDLNKIADATDGVSNAQNGLERANKRVEDAQKKLSQARKDAIKNLDDLILKERQAELAARGASLTLEESQESLRRALASGDTGGIDRARLAVDEAKMGKEVANRDVVQTQRDVRAARTQNVEKDPGVVSAKDSLSDARDAAEQAAKSLAKAKRGLDQAKKGADDVAGSVDTAASNLAYAMAQLTPAGRRMLDALTKLKATFKQVSGPMFDPIVDSVARAMGKTEKILKNPVVVETMRGLSKSVGKSMDELFDHFTSKETGGLFKGFVKDAKGNLPIVTDLLKNLGDSFLLIAKAAAPAFKELLRSLEGVTGRMRDYLKTSEGQAKVRKFFLDGIDALKAFGRALLATTRLFVNFMNPDVGGGTTAGIKTLDDYTAAIDKLNEKLKTSKGQKDVQEFLERAREGMKAMMPIVRALAKLFGQLFTDEGVDNLQHTAEFIETVLVPAFKTFLSAMSDLTKVMLGFLKLPVVGTMAKYLIAAGLITIAVSKLVAIFKIFPIAALRAFSFRDAETGQRRATALGRAAQTMAGKVKDAAVAAGRNFKNIATSAATSLRNAAVATANFAKRAVVSFAQAARAAVVYAATTARAVGASLVRQLVLAGLAVKAFATANTVASRVVMAASRVFALARTVMFGPWGIVIAAVIAALVYLQVKFNIFGKAFDAVKKVVSAGFAFIKRAVSSVIGFIKDHWKDILTILTGPFGLAVRLITDHFDGIKRGVRNGINDIVGFFKKLPGRIKDAMSGLGGLLKEVGKTAVNVMIAPINAAIKGLNKILGPKKILGKTVFPGIKIPEIPTLASGGYVTGQYSKGDRHPAMLAGDEVVMNPTQQAMVGRSRIMQVLKATGAKVIGQGGGKIPGYASGAYGGDDDGSAAKGGGKANVENLTLDLGVALMIIEQFGSRAKTSWNRTWSDIVKRLVSARSQINTRMKSIYTTIDTQQDRIGSRIVNGWKNINDQTGDQLKKFRDQIASSMDTIKTATYDGMSYIVKTTNSSLEAFDAKPLKVSVTAPKETKRAATGWIGNQGERGEDAVPIWVGRGEAVLNWGHQKIVNSALYEKYGSGLSELFKRNRGYHAGGAETGIAGFAKGGYTGPAGTGAGFGPISAFAKKKFGLGMTAGRTDHSLMTASGNVSDHSKGWAGDFSNGVLTPQEDAFSNFWKTKAPQIVKQLIWRNKDQFRGFPIGGHEDHVHLATKPEYAMDAPRMAKILSRLSRGLSIDALLSSSATGDGANVDHVEMPSITGTGGKMLQMIKGLLKKARGAANKLIDKKAAEAGVAGTGDAHDVPVKDFGSNGKTIFEFFKRAGFTDNQAAAWIGNLQQESGLNPGAIQSGGPGRGLVQWGGGRFTALQNFAASQKKPWTDLGTQLQFIMRELRGPESAAFSAIKAAKTLEEAVNAIGTKYERYGIAGDRSGPARAALNAYGSGTRAATGGFAGILAQSMSRMGFPAFAKGGHIDGPEGSEQPIIAHAGEWVLNKAQQARMAALTGLGNVSMLRDALGFTGGPTSFAGGGEVKKRTPYNSGSLRDRRREASRTGEYDAPDMNPADFDYEGAVGSYYVALSALAKNLRDLKKIGPKTKKRAEALGKQFDAVNDNVNELTKEGGVFDQIGTAITSYISTQARKLASSQFGAALNNKFKSANNTRSGREARDQIVNPTGSKDARARRRAGVGGIVLNQYDDAELSRENQQNLVGALKRYGNLQDRLERTYKDTTKTLSAVEKEIRPLERKAKTRKGLTKSEKAELGDLKEDRDNLTNKKNDLKKRREEAAAAVSEQVQALYESQMADFQRVTDAKQESITVGGKGRERNMAQVERMAREATALGRGDDLAKLESDRITIMKRQKDALAKAAEEAKRRGYNDLAKQYTDQVAELDTTIKESIAAQLQTAIDAVADTGATNLENIDRGNAQADLLDRIGGNTGLLGQVMNASGIGGLVTNGAGQMRSNALAATGSELMRQRDEYTKLLARTPIENEGARKDLEKRLADLAQQIAENTVATAENNAAITADRIARVKDAAQNKLGVSGGIRGLITAVTGNTGVPDPGRQAALLTGEQADQKGLMDSLADELYKKFGIDVRGLSGIALADAFTTLLPKLNSIESGLDPATKDIFRDLINSLLDTATAAEGTTAELKELNGGTQLQGFSSTAWKWFSEAIFTGMGDVLPQYTIPSFDTGGSVLRTGLAKVHSGEYVTNPAVKGQHPGGAGQVIHEGDINMEINQAGQPINKDEIAEKIAFRRRTSRSTR